MTLYKMKSTHNEVYKRRLNTRCKYRILLKRTQNKLYEKLHAIYYENCE